MPIVFREAAESTGAALATAHAAQSQDPVGAGVPSVGHAPAAKARPEGGVPGMPLMYARFGAPQAAALAVVMAPVMPVWDAGAFFAPLTERLVALGYQVIIFDTLSLDCAATDIEGFAQAWRQILQGLGPIRLLAGSALGGAVVQSLLDTRWAAGIPATLLISAPTQADARLDQRLGRMARLAAEGDLPHALHWLEHWIAPHHPVVRGLAPREAPTDTLHPFSQGLSGGKPPHHRGESHRGESHRGESQGGESHRGESHRGESQGEESRVACGRLARGFGLLLGLDVRAAVQGYPGKLLSLYGEQSQLVCAHNVTFPRTPDHLAVSIRASGMRPHIEQPATVWACVQDHLHLTAQVAP